MARNTIPSTVDPGTDTTLIGGAKWATAGATDDYEWAIEAGDLLFVVNLAATTPTFSIPMTTNSYGRGGTFTSPTIGQNTVYVKRFWRKTGWAQSDGMCWVDTTSDDLRFTIIRFSPAIRTAKE